MKILFVCSQGRHRSKTAKELWERIHPKDEVKFMGLFNDEFSKDLLFWADKIFVMEYRHEDEIKKLNIGLWGKCHNLDIPDIYPYNSPALVKLLLDKFTDI